MEEGLLRLGELNESVLLYLTPFPPTRSTKFCLAGRDDGSGWSVLSASPSSFFGRNRAALSSPSLEGKRSRDMVTNGEPRRVLPSVRLPPTSASIPRSLDTVPPDLSSLPDQELTPTLARLYSVRRPSSSHWLYPPTASSPVEALRSQEEVAIVSYAGVFDSSRHLLASAIPLLICLVHLRGAYSRPVLQQRWSREMATGGGGQGGV